ncbi:hypothetical protein [Streptomyces sp. NPDC002952]|uniref:hypothetical protein n=1 Tax=Streptomyces sp. NPDC002952 TaxID=3364673 RepID=UPI003677ECBD
MRSKVRIGQASLWVLVLFGVSVEAVEEPVAPAERRRESTEPRADLAIAFKLVRVRSFTQQPAPGRTCALVRAGTQTENDILVKRQEQAA